LHILHSGVDLDLSVVRQRGAAGATRNSISRRLEAAFVRPGRPIVALMLVGSGEQISERERGSECLFLDGDWQFLQRGLRREVDVLYEQAQGTP